MLDQFLGVAAILQHLDEVAQVDQRVTAARGLLVLGVKAVRLVLVAPVGGHALLGHLIHGLGADLHLDAHAPIAHHGGVQGPVVVALGRGDEVLEPLWHRGPGAMDDAEGAVAILLIVDDHPEGIDVRQLGKPDGFALQLPPDREGMLFAAIDPGRNSRSIQLGRHLLADRGHRPALLGPEHRQPAHDRIARHGVQVREGQLLQLLADPVDADGAGQRAVDVEGFPRDPLALGGLLDEMQGAHVVQAVGQFHQQDADVLGDRQDELPQVLGLAQMRLGQLQLGQLGDAFDQFGDLGPEQALDLFARRVGVLDDIVQQRGDDGLGIEAIVGEDARHLDRVGEIGVAGGPLLGPMGAHGVDVGAVQQRLVGGGVVGADLLDQLELPQHLGTRRAGRERGRY